MNKNLYKFAGLSDDTKNDLFTDAFFLDANVNGWNFDNHAFNRILNRTTGDEKPLNKFDYLDNDDIYSLGLDYYTNYDENIDSYKRDLEYNKFWRDQFLKEKDEKAYKEELDELKRINTKHKMNMILHNLLKNIDKKNEHKYNWFDSLKRKLTGQQDDPLYNYEKTKALLEFNKPSLESVNQAYLDLNKMKHKIDKSDLSDYYVDQVKLLKRLGLKTEKD